MECAKKKRSAAFNCVQGALAMLLGMQAVVVASMIMLLDSEHSKVGQFRVVSVMPQHSVTNNINDSSNNNNNTTTTTTTGDNLYFAPTHTTATSGIDVRIIVIVTLAVGATLQSVALVVEEGRWVRSMRWLECVICVPAIVMAVGVEAGVRDVYAIEALFGLAWGAQLLAFCAEGWLQQAAVLVASVPVTPPRPLPINASPSQPQVPYYPNQEPSLPRALWVTAIDPLLQLLAARAWLVPHFGALVLMVMAFAPSFHVLIIADPPPRWDAAFLVCCEFVLLVAANQAVQASELFASTACVESPIAFDKVFFSARRLSTASVTQKPNLMQFDNIIHKYFNDNEDENDDENDEDYDDELGGAQAGGVIVSFSRVEQVARILRRCDVLYTLLSFLSKTLLCWSVLGPFL
jgi:hypothetical protein